MAELSLSIIERLIDLDPKSSQEPAPAVFIDLEGYRESVRRDVERLLNQRCPLADPPEGLEEVRSSVLCYGLPDLSNIDLRNDDDRRNLCVLIGDAIARFEPRLRQVKVSLQSSDENSPLHLSFKIEAILRMEPAPAPVTFDTDLETASGFYEVGDVQDAG